MCKEGSSVVLGTRQVQTSVVARQGRVLLPGVAEIGRTDTDQATTTRLCGTSLVAANSASGLFSRQEGTNLSQICVFRTNDQFREQSGFSDYCEFAYHTKNTAKIAKGYRIQTRRESKKYFVVRSYIMSMYHVRRDSSNHVETDCSVCFLLNILRSENEGDLLFSLPADTALAGAVV